jgi:hypothetical protein
VGACEHSRFPFSRWMSGWASGPASWRRERGRCSLCARLNLVTRAKTKRQQPARAGRLLRGRLDDPTERQERDTHFNKRNLHGDATSSLLNGAYATGVPERSLGYVHASGVTECRDFSDVLPVRASTAVHAKAISWTARRLTARREVHFENVIRQSLGKWPLAG